jgi:hypothetical protein
LITVGSAALAGFLLSGKLAPREKKNGTIEAARATRSDGSYSFLSLLTRFLLDIVKTFIVASISTKPSETSKPGEATKPSEQGDGGLTSPHGT